MINFFWFKYMKLQLIINLFSLKKISDNRNLTLLQKKKFINHYNNIRFFN